MSQKKVPLEIRRLGLIEYEKAWELQKQLVHQRIAGDIPDTLLLLEHPPVYTCGVSSRTVTPSFLPHPLHVIERGGDMTYHGPGQLVGYPIIHLGERGLAAADYLRELEAIIIGAVRGLGLEATTIKGFTGVWARGKKIASIGMAVRQEVTYHGFALNVNCDLTPFHLINPCQLEPESMGTLFGLLGRPVNLEQVCSLVARVFKESDYSLEIASDRV